MILFGLEVFTSVILSQQEETASIPSAKLFSIFRPLFKFSSEVAKLHPLLVKLSGFAGEDRDGDIGTTLQSGTPAMQLGLQSLHW